MITEKLIPSAMKKTLGNMEESSSNIARLVKQITDNPNQSKHWYSKINDELLKEIQDFQIDRTHYMEYAVYTAQHR